MPDNAGLPVSASEIQEQLAASFASAASQVLENDEEAIALEESIHQSLVEEKVDLNSEDRGEYEATSIISGYVDGLLARLKVSLERLRVDVQVEALLSLHVDQVLVETKYNDFVSNPPTANDEDPEGATFHSGDAAEAKSISEITRTISIHDVMVTLDEATDDADPDSDSDSSDSSDSSPFLGRRLRTTYQEESTGDLHSSKMTESSASLYESAIEDDSAPSPLASSSASSSSGSATRGESRSIAEKTILNMGQEAMTVTLKTRKERERPPDKDRQRLVRVLRVSTHVEVAIGHTAVALQPEQICALIHAVARLKAPAASSNTFQSADPSGSARGSNKVRPLELTLSVSLKSFNVVCTHQEISQLHPGGQRDKALDSIRAFLHRPQRVLPDIGHLRLKLDGLRADYSTPTAEGSTAAAPSYSVAIADLGLFEHLPPSLVASDDEQPRTLPILIFDHNLAHTLAEPSTPTSSKQRTTDFGHRKMEKSQLSKLGLDAIDWRRSLNNKAVPAHPATSADSAPGAARSARFSSSLDRKPSPLPLHNPYVKTTFGERGWKIRPKHRSTPSFSSESGDPMTPVIHVVCRLASRNAPQKLDISLAPLHVFADLSLITRLLPLLRSLASVLNESSNEAPSVDLSESTATILGASSHPERYLLGDLDDVDEASKATSLNLRTEVVRIELRVPQSSFKDLDEEHSHELRKRRFAGVDTRAGIIILEARSFEADVGGANEPQKLRGVHFARGAEPPRTTGKTVAKFSLREIAAFHLKPSQSGRAQAFASIGSLEDPDVQSFGQLDPPLPPCVRILESTQRAAPTDGARKNVADCRLPAVRIAIGKEDIDSLQFAADDLSQLVNVWTSESLGDSDGSDNAGLRILGSRFFGTRAGQSMMSSSTDSTATVKNSNSTSAVTVSISEASVRLKLPSRPSSSSPEKQLHRDIVVNAAEIDVRLENDRAPNTTMVHASVLTFSVRADETDGGGTSEAASNIDILSRTMEPGLTRAAKPMVSLGFESFSEPGTSYRESGIDIALSCITMAPPFDTELLDQIRVFIKAPEGVFEDVEPNEVTRISLKVRDCSLLLAVPSHKAQAALAVGEASIKTRITSHAPKTAVKLAARDVNAFVIEEAADKLMHGTFEQARSSSEHWFQLGFARIFALSEVKAGVGLNSLTRPDVDIKVSRVRAKMFACADTLDVLGDLAAVLSAASARTPKKGKDGEREADSAQNHDHGDEDNESSPSRSNSFGTSSGSRVDLLASVEEDAFRSAAPMASVADLIEDDVPSDPTFLGETQRYHPDIVESELDSTEFFGGESVASLSINPQLPGNVISADEDVTIRLLDPKGIRPNHEYFTDPDLTPDSRAMFESSASSIRVRVTDFDFSLRLHAGYDWVSTRRAVEEEARRVKRRLQKIKQLLAEGQTPDDSVEAAMSSLMESMHISLPSDPAEMDPAEMIRAVDEGLGAPSSAASSSDAGTWQPLPRMGSGSTGEGKGRSLSKLERSRKSMIDFNFSGLEVEFDLLDPIEPHFASRVSVTAETFEIIDNIKTSTWHAFLTRMKVKEAAFRPSSEARMVRVELLTLRPNEKTGHADGEVRVRAKIEPLRLHVDQDALDFLKRFFAFKPPGQEDAAPAKNTGASPAPFIRM